MLRPYIRVKLQPAERVHSQPSDENIIWYFVKFLDYLINNHFTRSVAILGLGTAIAQAIPVLSSPILTRLYTPADFGILAVFMALVSSFIPLVCGKYEVAMVLPRSQSQGVHLLGIAFQFSLLISSISMVGLLVFKEELLDLLDTPQLDGWIYLAPLALLFSGTFIALSYFANRQHQYARMAKLKMIRAIAIVTVNIGLGLVGFGFEGLLIGSLAGLFLATCYFFYLYRKQLSIRILVWTNKKSVLSRKYKDYPIYNASTGLLNGITLSLPVFFIAHYYSESVVGYFALVVRVVNAPLSIISASVSQVNLKKIIDLVNGQSEVLPYLYKVALALAGLVTMPTLVIMIFAPEIFVFLFGSQWSEAGVYAQILIPALAVKFVSSTLSSTMGATNNNKYGAMWKICSFVTTFGVLACFAPKGDIMHLLYALLVNDSLLYIFYFYLIVRSAKYPNNINKLH